MILMDKVYEIDKECCGCGICMAACSKHAISMKCDEKGFVYPTINHDICIECGACKRACVFSKRSRKNDKSSILKCYAACNKDQRELNKSTSGGVFSAVAHSFLDQGGNVVGAYMGIADGKVDAYHIIIDTIESLPILQGSKYVQSNLWECLDPMDTLLKAGKKILFSGTPCQVDAIKNKFKKYLETQLFTIDVVCHCVPNKILLEAFIAEYQKKNNIELKKIVFRDKENGWGHKGSIITNDNKNITFTREEFSFYSYFVAGEISRDSCYFCPYACQERVGDITIGDYWGIKKYDPQLLVENGGGFEFEKGVSCLIVNSEHGEELLEKFGSMVQKVPIEVQHVVEINKQLREPSKYTELREKIFSLYKNKGYSAVEKLFRKQKNYRNIKNMIKLLVKR